MIRLKKRRTLKIIQIILMISAIVLLDFDIINLLCPTLFFF